jgi:hypothetical protein
VFSAFPLRLTVACLWSSVGRMSKSRFLWQCFTTAFSKAWKWFSHARGVVAIIVAAIAPCFAADFIKRKGWDVNVWFVIGPVAVFALVFLWKLVDAPFELYKELEEKLASKKNEDARAIDKLMTELHYLTTRVLNVKNVEVINVNRTDSPIYHARIVVQNCGSSSTVKNVFLKLKGFEPQPISTELQDRFTPVVRTFPVTLKPEGVSIHPGAESSFELLRFMRIGSDPMIQIAESKTGFRPKIRSQQINLIIEYVSYQFTLVIGGEDQPSSEWQLNMAIGRDALGVFKPEFQTPIKL